MRLYYCMLRWVRCAARLMIYEWIKIATEREAKKKENTKIKHISSAIAICDFVFRKRMNEFSLPNDEVAIVLARSCTGRVHFFRLPFFPINFMQSVTTLWSRLLHITTAHTHSMRDTNRLPSFSQTVRRLVSTLSVSNNLSGSSTANTPRIGRLTSKPE